MIYLGQRKLLCWWEGEEPTVESRVFHFCLLWMAHALYGRQEALWCVDLCMPEGYS